MKIRLSLLGICAALLVGGCQSWGSNEPMAERAEALRRPPNVLTGQSGTQTPAEPADAVARLESDEQGARLLVADGYSGTWRRVGTALEQLGFTVEARDRAEGRYRIRYDASLIGEDEGGGFWSALAFWRDDEDTVRNYVLRLREIDSELTQVELQDEAGDAVPAARAERILELLRGQLALG